MERKLLIIGAGGHGKVCAEIAKKMDRWKEILFYDDKLVGNVNGINIVEKEFFQSLKDTVDYFVAIGNNEIRFEKTKKLLSMGCNIVSLIDPTSVISKFSTIGIGTVVMPKTVINASTKIGDGVIINTGSVIDHDSHIGSYAHLSPNSTITGGCKIGDFVWVGSTTTVINQAEIVSKTLIGAMSLVNKDIKEAGTYFGIPAEKRS